MYSNKIVQHSIKPVSSSIVLTHLIQPDYATANKQWSKLLVVLKPKVNHLKSLEVTCPGEISACQPTACAFVTPPCEYIIVWEKFHIKNFSLVVWHDKN